MSSQNIFGELDSCLTISYILRLKRKAGFLEGRDENEKKLTYFCSK